ncbi:hypothetical protein [Rhizobium tubonense]|uniref:Uncharacterized protein n=1 Tax=Rhizobium tubonense TaxID=484088 RepID=A0A2W4F0A3_9HYPH|nr:hypothetical protein [Rhizobium tubonense]PZM15803.1 hypothetical protein CPY51_05730 [Rhizobium tubonense]
MATAQETFVSGRSGTTSARSAAAATNFKLEFLFGQALAEGCDTVIAVGGLQSNFARLTAAACAKLGLGCELVLSQMVPRDDHS